MLWGQHITSCRTPAQGRDFFHSFLKEVLGTAPPHQTGQMQIQTHLLIFLLCDLGQITDSLSHGFPVCNTTLHIAGLLGGIQGKAFAKSSYPNAWRKDVSFLAGRRVSDWCCPPPPQPLLGYERLLGFWRWRCQAPSPIGQNYWQVLTWFYLNSSGNEELTISQDILRGSLSSYLQLWESSRKGHNLLA